MNYGKCRRCGSALLPGGDLCGLCMMPDSFREGHCWSCGLVDGAGHRGDCFHAADGQLDPERDRG